MKEGTRGGGGNSDSTGDFLARFLDVFSLSFFLLLSPPPPPPLLAGVTGMILSKIEEGPWLVSAVLVVLLFVFAGGMRGFSPTPPLLLLPAAFAFLCVFLPMAAFGVCDRLFFGCCLRRVVFALPCRSERIFHSFELDH